jgi:hypothetical protein
LLREGRRWWGTGEEEAVLWGNPVPFLGVEGKKMGEESRWMGRIGMEGRGPGEKLAWEGTA